MNSSEQSRFVFAGSPVFGCEPAPAHSGPELIPSLPDPSLGIELARVLLSDTVQVQHYHAPLATGSPMPDTVIRLSRH